MHVPCPGILDVWIRHLDYSRSKVSLNLDRFFLLAQMYGWILQDRCGIFFKIKLELPRIDEHRRKREGILLEVSGIEKIERGCFAPLSLRYVILPRFHRRIKLSDYSCAVSYGEFHFGRYPI